MARAHCRSSRLRVPTRWRRPGSSHFLPELVILGLKHGFRIIEVPVNYRGRIGLSKITGNLMGAIKTGLKMIGLVLQYRFFGRPIV